MNDFHVVLLRYHVSAAHDLLQYIREHRPLIHIEVGVDTIELTESDGISSDS